MLILNKLVFLQNLFLRLKAVICIMLMILCKIVQVQFMGEGAIDEGRPKQELWCLLGDEIRAKTCAGDSDRLSLDHDITDLQVHSFNRHTYIQLKKSFCSSIFKSQLQHQLGNRHI